MAGQRDEIRTTGAQYVFNFFNAVTQLNDSYSQLQIVLWGLGKELDDQQKKLLQDNVRLLKYSVLQTSIQYRSICKKTKTKYVDNTGIIQTIGEREVPYMKDVKEYVDLMNDFLTEKVMVRLLETSQDIVEGLYGTSQE